MSSNGHIISCGGNRTAVVSKVSKVMDEMDASSSAVVAIELIVVQRMW